MAEAINGLGAEMRLAQLLGDDYVAQASPASSAAPAAQPAGDLNLSGNIFDDVLSKAVESLNGVSQSEYHANEVLDKYLRGEAELHEVMVAQSKMSIMVQLAVTTINSAVTTFKEITQMQV